MTDITPPTPEEQVIFDAAKGAVDEFVIALSGNRDELEASLAQVRQVASNIDLNRLTNALHVPYDAGEYTDGLKEILIRIPENWGRWIRCQRGWYPIIVEINKTLASRFPEYQVLQVKEKFAALRYYATLSDGSKDEQTLFHKTLDELELKANEIAAKTCERCGACGQWRICAGGDWQQIICDECADSDDRSWLTHDQYEIWLETEAPKLVAAAREQWIAAHLKRNIVLLTSNPAIELSVDVTIISDAVEAYDAAFCDWDEIWLDQDNVGAAFVDGMAERYSAHVSKLTAELDAWQEEGDEISRGAQSGVSGFRAFSYYPPDVPNNFRLRPFLLQFSPDKNRTMLDRLNRELGVGYSFLSKYAFCGDR